MGEDQDSFIMLEPNSAPLPLEITPAEVRRRLQAGEALRLIDVREPFEFQISKIDGAELLPMRLIPGALQHLEDSVEDLILICHHGVRSLNAAAWLREKGVANCQSMSGGIDRWSTEIDAAVPRY